MIWKIYAHTIKINLYLHVYVHDYMIPCSPKRVGDGIFMVIIWQVFVCCRWLRHSFLWSVLKPRYFNLHPDLKKKREREKSIFPNVTQLYVFAAILIRSNYFKLRIKLIRVVVTYRPKKNRHIMPVDNQ